jgi:hypothetical protein
MMGNNRQSRKRVDELVGEAQRWHLNCSSECRGKVTGKWPKYSNCYGYAFGCRRPGLPEEQGVYEGTPKPGEYAKRRKLHEWNGVYPENLTPTPISKELEKKRDQHFLDKRHRNYPKELMVDRELTAELRGQQYVYSVLEDARYQKNCKVGLWCEGEKLDKIIDELKKLPFELDRKEYETWISEGIYIVAMWNRKEGFHFAKRDILGSWSWKDGCHDDKFHMACYIKNTKKFELFKDEDIPDFTNQEKWDTIYPSNHWRFHCFFLVKGELQVA